MKPSYFQYIYEIKFNKKSICDDIWIFVCQKTEKFWLCADKLHK